MNQPKWAMKEMTWVECAAALERGVVVFLPLGSQEEQGPHAPMGDYVLAEAIALEAAKRSGALCAPVLPFGYADVFRNSPGGIQLQAETFIRVLEDVIGSLLEHGFDRIVICNGHTTNAPLVSQVAWRVRRARGVIVPSLNLWRGLPNDEWTRLYGNDAAKARGHGADPITSVYLHLLPDLVSAIREKPIGRRQIMGLPSEPTLTGVVFERGSVDLPIDAFELTDDGVIAGDPRLATAAIGGEIFGWIVEWVAGFGRHFKACDPRVIEGPGPDKEAAASGPDV
jgi:creatinine amidohydrolase